jgi:hypothetical protein
MLGLICSVTKRQPHAPFLSRSTSPIVPGETGFAGAKGSSPKETGLNQEAKVFAEGVEMDFSRGREQRVSMKDDNALSAFPRDAFEPNAQIDLFACEQFFAKSADFTESRGLAENEGAGHPGKRAADYIPKANHEIGFGIVAVELHRAAAGHAFPGSDLFGNAFEKGPAWVRIGIDKEQPIARGGGGAGVARAGDLIKRFEDDFGTGGAGDFGSLIGGIIVADDQFSFPAALLEGLKGGVDVAQGFAEPSFFVESWDDGGDFQARDSICLRSKCDANMKGMAEQEKTQGTEAERTKLVSATRSGERRASAEAFSYAEAREQGSRR